MDFSASRPARPSPARGRAPRLVGSGAEAEVWTSGTDAVVKRFFWKPGIPGRVREEAAALEALRDASPEDVRFPRLIGYDPAAGSLTMERAGGKTLLAWLEEGQSLPRGLGARMARGLTAYVDRLQRTFHDFGAVNVLWDPEQDALWFIDLASDALTAPAHTRSERLAQSIGYFLGVAAYETARPGRGRRLPAAATLIGLVRAMRHELGPQVAARRVAQTAWLQFKDAAFQGTLPRRAWYATAGLIWAFGVVAAALRP